MDDTGGDDLDDILGEGDEDQEGEVEDQNEEVLDQEERWMDADAPLSGGDDDVVESEDEIQSRINEVVTDAEILEILISHSLSSFDRAQTSAFVPASFADSFCFR